MQIKGRFKSTETKVTPLNVLRTFKLVLKKLVLRTECKCETLFFTLLKYKFVIDRVATLPGNLEKPGI